MVELNVSLIERSFVIYVALFPLCVFRREGEGVRIFWDRLREPTFASKWNPFTTELPYITFTYHPVRSVNDTFTTICDVSGSIS